MSPSCLVQSATLGPAPDDVAAAAFGPSPDSIAPATPVRLPQCVSQQTSSADSRHPSLVRFLQASIHRPVELDESHFAALGVHTHPDCPGEELLPDRSYLPSRTGWETMSWEGAGHEDTTFRRKLSNGRLSPEARTYQELYRQLSIDSQSAFRTIRRVRPEPGVPSARLGNSYEFYRQLEMMAHFWDDTSVQAAGQEPEPAARERVTYRTESGESMPAELRHNIITALVKLACYNFGCHLQPPSSRVEPRLHLLEPSLPLPGPTDKTKEPRRQRASYFPSGCIFLVRTPAELALARAGRAEGPLAAVSARNSTKFVKASDSTIDFGRELVSALATAQLRARQGCREKRFGEGQWWATARRWGGGAGGLIGRELEARDAGEARAARATRQDLAQDGGEDADRTWPSSSATPTPLLAPSTSARTATGSRGGSVTRAAGVSRRRSPVSPSLGPQHAQPASKKSRRNCFYDNYRMVRLPASNWDKRMTYSAVGREPGSDYDDVFVVSSLFHHVCIIRVRVPDKLLDVLDGGSDAPGWGKLHVWRSKWLDLFLAEDRLEALRLLWAATAWMMRDTGDKTGDESADRKGDDMISDEK